MNSARSSSSTGVNSTCAGPPVRNQDSGAIGALASSMPRRPGIRERRDGMMSGKVMEAIGDWERAPYCLHSGKSPAILPWSAMSEPQTYEARLRTILYADEDLMAFLRIARSLDLPQWRFVSGGIYQTVWNHLTDTPRGTGIKDLDLIYFDDSDLGWEAEDAVIKRAETVFGDRWPVEVRNQARVHLWYEQRFGAPYTRLRSADESLERYASTRMR